MTTGKKDQPTPATGLTKDQLQGANPKLAAAFVAFAEKLGRKANKIVGDSEQNDLDQISDDLSAEARKLAQQAKLTPRD